MSEVLILARSFFNNAVREKLFIGLFAVTLLLFGFAHYLSSLALAEPYRIFAGFGSVAVWIVGILVIISFCIFDFKKNFENRTAQVILARPISRGMYILSTFVSNGALLWLYCTGSFAILWLWFRALFGSWNVPVIYGMLVSGFALTLLAGLALLCACLFESSALSLGGFVALLTVCLLNAPALSLAQRFSTHSVSTWVNLAITYVLPTLSHYRVTEIMAHNSPPPVSELGGLLVYTSFFSLAALLLASLIFNSRDLP